VFFGDVVCAQSPEAMMVQAFVCPKKEQKTPKEFNTWMFPKIVVPPNHPYLIGFSIIHHPFWDTPIFGNTQMKIKT